jgi:hypothetical protein
MASDLGWEWRSLSLKTYKVKGGKAGFLPPTSTLPPSPCPTTLLSYFCQS